MPIEFQPPSTQPFQITPTQYVDPLQTLAQMGQLRTQGLQQQTAQMGLEQERLKLDSNKAWLGAMVQGGGDVDKTYQYAVQSGKVLPGDLISFKEHLTKMLQDAAALDKTTRENTATDIERLRGLYANVKSPDDLTVANATADQLGIGKQVPRLTQFTDPTHVTAFSNSLATQKQVLEEAEKRAATAREQAQEKLAGVQTTEAQQKVDFGTKQQLASDIRRLPVDPATGTPTPAAWLTVLKNPSYKGLNLPEQPTKADLDRIVESTVPEEKLPEYKLNQRINELGMFGKDQWNQFLYQNAKTFQNPDGTPKAPGQVTPQEYNTIKGRWAEYTADPVIRALAIGQKTGQEKLVAAQVASLPSEKAIEGFARDLLNLDMAPSQFSELRSGRVSWGPQVFQKAREIAAAEGKQFSPATLDAKFKTWENTEKAFGDGEEAGMVRSFGNLIKHASMAVDASKALSHHDLPMLQRIAGVLGVATGGSAETVYDTIAAFVADEASKSFLPGGGGQSERAEKLSHFERSLGDKARADNLKAVMALADSQREELERQYAEGTFGKGPRIGKLFSPEVLAARDKVLGRKPAAQQRAPAAGGLQYVKRAMGPNNHEIGQTADGKWHDVQTGAVIQ